MVISKLILFYDNKFYNGNVTYIAKSVVLN